MLTTPIYLIDFEPWQSATANNNPKHGDNQMARDTFTLVGGYPLIYFTDDACTLCGNCAGDDDEAHIHYEGDPIHCDECNETTESAYGIPE